MNKLHQGDPLAFLRDKWQERLNIQHWDIRVRFKKFKDKKQQGRVKIHLSEDIAEIYVTKESDYKWIEPYDMEFILLHEMLHIVFEVSPETDSLQAIIFERGLNRVAKLLLKLDRN